MADRVLRDVSKLRRFIMKKPLSDDSTLKLGAQLTRLCDLLANARSRIENPASDIMSQDVREGLLLVTLEQEIFLHLLTGQWYRFNPDGAAEEI